MPFLIAAAAATGPLTSTAAMAATAADIALIGTGITAYGTYEAGQAEKRAEEYNAKVQQQQAEAERKAAAFEAGQVSEEGRRLQARQRVLFAQSGLTAAGTPLLVLQDTAKKIEEDIQMRLWGGERRAGYYEAGAGLSRMRGKSAARAGLFGAGSSLLTGAGESYYRYKSMK